MKKFLASLLVAAAFVPASAQTEFRHIPFDQALAAAKAEQKLVFIDFFTDWCGPCKKMSTSVFPQQSVGDYMNATFIPVKYDAEKEGAELAKKYGIHSYPTYVITNDKGEEVTRFSGAMDGDRFLGKLQAQLDPELNPARIRERYESGDRTPQVVNAYAMQFMEQRKEKEGFEVIDNYWKSLSDADRLKHDNLFLFTTYTVDLDNERASFMKAARNEFAEADRKAIDKALGALLNNKLASYFSGYMWKEGKYDQAAFNTLKADIQDLGLNEDGKNQVMYDLIEKRPAVDDATYLAYCESRYDELDRQTRNLFVFNITRLLDTKNPEIGSAVSKFIRARLSEMTPMAIQLAGHTLNDIEGK